MPGLDRAEFHGESLAAGCCASSKGMSKVTCSSRAVFDASCARCPVVLHFVLQRVSPQTPDASMIEVSPRQMLARNAAHHVSEGQALRRYFCARD
jgi:hypothetical protein